MGCNNNNKIELPNANTIWKSNRSTISPSQPAVLTWDNGNGIIFKRTNKY